MNAQARRRGVPSEVKGLLLLGICLGLVALSIAMYLKVFSSVVNIDAVVPRSGLQLQTNGDVRIKGALVGRITGVDSTSRGAVIHMAIDSDAASGIPSNAAVAIVPTTLFGQKYVELVVPSGAAAAPIRDGEVLAAATNGAPLEVGTVLDDLEPVLTAVHPEKLSSTLAAIADGLNGRGYELGRLITDSGHLLSAFNQQLPLFEKDLRLFATLSQTYAALTPDLLTTLASSAATAGTILHDQVALVSLLARGTTFGDLATTLLSGSADALVATGAYSRSFLATLARYSAEFPCIFRGLAIGDPAAARAFVNGIFQVHIVLGAQANGYTAKDRPRFGDVGRGPSCAGLPNPKFPNPAFPANDGVGGH